jgi:predicted transcriptional regulator
MKDEVTIISIERRHTTRIFSGEKTAELRKSLPRQLKDGSLILIWETSPSRKMAGVARVEKIMKAPLEGLWAAVKDRAGATRADFDNYFTYGEGHKKYKEGVGIFLSESQEFAVKPDLASLPKKIDFRPPRNYCYATDAQLAYFKATIPEFSRWMTSR